jgi:hypothetical protein
LVMMQGPQFPASRFREIEYERENHSPRSEAKSCSQTCVL